MLNIELKTNFEEVVAEIDLFANTREVLEVYNVEKGALEERKAYLTNSISELEDKHTQITIEADTFKSDVGKYLAAQRQLKDLIMEIEVMMVLLEEVDEQLQDLKVQHFPKFKASLNADRNHGIDVTPVMNKLKNDLLDEIINLSNKMNEQFSAVAPEIYDVILDDEIVRVYPQDTSYLFKHDVFRPMYAEANDTVISRYDLFNAVGGTKL